MGHKISEFFKNIRRVLRDREIPLSQKPAACLGRHYPLFLYIVVGGLTTALNLAIYFLLVNATGIDPYTSTVIAWIVAMIFAFITNKLWVFKDKDWSLWHALYQFGTFSAARLLSLGFEELFLFIGIGLCHFNENLVKLPIQVFVVLINYVASKLVIFRKKPNKQ